MRTSNTSPDNSSGQTQQVNHLSKSNRLFCFLAILFGCFICIYWLTSRTSLWEDEIIAITHANQPLPGFFVETLRNDIHPPLYFLQLKWWQDLGFTSDTGLLLNSFCWAALSLFTLFLVARKTFGQNAAIFAAAIFATMPMFAYSSSNLRMYGLVPCLGLLVWYTNSRWFAERTWGWLAVAAFLEVSLAYVHAIEFYFVAFITFATLIEALRQHGIAKLRTFVHGQNFYCWFGIQVLVGLLILPLAGSAVIRGSDAAAPESLINALTVPGSLIAGWGPDSSLSVRLAGLIIFLIFAVAGLKNRSSSTVTAIVPIAAVAIAIAVSMAAKPMLKTPVFAANLLPFLALGAGVGAAGNVVWLRKAVLACIFILCCAGFPIMQFYADTNNYLRASEYLKENAHPGDVVVIPSVSIYWGIVRYAVQGNWGKPLEIMPLETNEQWTKLINKLGPSLSKSLGLVPKTNFVSKDGITYVIGSNAKLNTQETKRVWLVNKKNYLIDADLGKRFVRNSVVSATHSDLLISKFDADINGSPTATHPLNDPLIKNQIIGIAP